MLHVLGIFSCGYLVEIPENSVLFGGSGFLVGLNVLSMTLEGFSAVQKLTSSQKFQSCAQPLELIDCSDSKLFACAELKHLEKLGFSNCGNWKSLSSAVSRMERLENVFV